MKLPGRTLIVVVALTAHSLQADVAGPVHVWEKQELTFAATNTYDNPYLEVIVWVDLSGPASANAFMDSGTATRPIIFVCLPPPQERGPGKVAPTPMTPVSPENQAPSLPLPEPRPN